MIQFITGKPGDGKSLFATRLLIDALIYKDVFVVTNIPLQLGPLQEYVSKRICGAFDIDSRVKVLRDEDVSEFYRFRSGGLVLDHSPDFRQGKSSERVDREEFNARMKAEFLKLSEKPEYQVPVWYFIDECHEYFSSREWASNGRGTLFYASKHRHLHDEIYLITQVMENVEKQLRNLVSETHQTRNYLRRSVGPFQMRPVFKVRSYYGVPTGQNDNPYSVSTHDVDAEGVGACYQTVGALGVQVRPEKLHNKGYLPWWTLPIAGVVGVLLVFGVLYALPRVAMKSGGYLGKKIAEETGAKVGKVVPIPASDHTAEAPPGRKQDTPVVRLVGVYGKGPALILCYEDGSRVAAAGGPVGLGMYRLRDGSMIAPSPSKATDRGSDKAEVRGGAEAPTPAAAKEEARSAGSNSASPEETVYLPRDSSGIVHLRNPASHSDFSAFSVR